MGFCTTGHILPPDSFPSLPDRANRERTNPTSELISWQIAFEGIVRPHSSVLMFRTKAAPWLTSDKVSVPACEIQMDLAESLLSTKFRMVDEHWWTKGYLVQRKHPQRSNPARPGTRTQIQHQHVENQRFELPRNPIQHSPSM